MLDMLNDILKMFSLVLFCFSEDLVLMVLYHLDPVYRPDLISHPSVLLAQAYLYCLLHNHSLLRSLHCHYCYSNHISSLIRILQYLPTDYRISMKFNNRLVFKMLCNSSSNLPAQPISFFPFLLPYTSAKWAIYMHTQYFPAFVPLLQVSLSLEGPSPLTFTFTESVVSVQKCHLLVRRRICYKFP